MAKKPKPTGVALTPVITLLTIAACGVNGTFAPVEVYRPLLEKGLVEVNTSMQNDQGWHAVRATMEGMELAENPPEDEVEEELEPEVSSAPWNGKTTVDVPFSPKVNTAVVNIPTLTSTTFVIEDSVPIPTIRRKKSVSLYPFDELQPGQSFFVPNTAERPEAAKSMASTVSSANARYAEPTGAVKLNAKGVQVPETRQTRNFIVRAVDGGARVWRTA